MKHLFIEARRKHFPALNLSKLNLPNPLFLAYSIQYKPLAEQVKAQLASQGTKIAGFQQVLGCTILKSNSPILLIGSGKFHALNLALQGNKVITLNNDNFAEDIKRIEQKIKASRVKFLSSQRIGILVSIKPGQNNLEEALALTKKLENKGKSVYLFLGDNLNLAELENFQLDSYVNTACPGLFLDSPGNSIINPKDCIF